jgi:serine/threonine protein kinase
MPKLVCRSGPTAGHEYALTKDVTILGRQSSCDVPIVDGNASRAHCEIRRDGKLFSLVDLGSRNGTQLNGKKVGERQLAFGDRISVGKVEFLFVKEPGDVELKDLLSKYEIQEKIGEGGMGIVYKANQRSMARVVALKILAPRFASKPRFVEQFTREARAAGSLNHPNIIQVHDVGTENDIHYFSMEFVDGPTAMQLLKSSGTLPVDDAIEIVRQCAKALEYAHSHRLIHQDIKPDNIMVGANNIVKLADLGISKTFDEAESDNAPKKVMGTPHYMAPEAALGKRVDQRIDIYSLGATAWHLLTGKTPFQGANPSEVLKQHVMEPLPLISTLNPEVPGPVAQIIAKMLEKKPEARYQSATEVLDALRRLGEGRQSGGETMILRRYAKGSPAASIPTPASGTTGHRFGGENTTPEGSWRQESGPQTLKWVIAAAIAVVGIGSLAVVGRNLWLMSHPAQTVADPGPVVGPVPATGAAPTSATPAAGDAPDPALARASQAAASLAALDAQLTQDGDKADADAILRKLNTISKDLDADGKERAKGVRDRLAKLMERRHTDQVQAGFAALGEDVSKLQSDRDYDNALKRLDGFKDRKEPSVAADFDKLRAAVDQARTAYLDDLHQKIQLLASAKDAKGLKDLRDGLPRAQLGTSVEQDILAAIKTLDDQEQARYAAVVATAGKDLMAWRLGDVDADWKNGRDAMGATPAGTQFDQYHDTAQKLGDLVTALGTKLRAHPIRYHGVLVAANDPDLVDANLDEGLKMRVSTGGDLGVKWSSLSPDDLGKVVQLVLGHDGDAYQGALGVLAGLKK